MHVYFIESILKEGCENIFLLYLIQSATNKILKSIRLNARAGEKHLSRRIRLSGMSFRLHPHLPRSCIRKTTSLVRL